MTDRSAEQLQLGEVHRDIGRTHALDAACAEWRDRAMATLEIHFQPGVRDTIEAVRDEVGDPPTGSVNAWGGLVAGAVRSGLIRRVGSAQARRPSAHARWLGIYEAVAP